MFKVSLPQCENDRGKHPPQWYWVARVDLFCAWLSHRKMFTGQRLGNGKVIPPPHRNSPLRKMLRPEWIRENVKHTRYTKRVAECLRDPNLQGAVEWKAPILLP